MLILVSVSIRIATQSGLFEKTGKATQDWQTEQNKEEELAGGQVTIDNVTYNSIDEYIKQTQCSHQWSEFVVVKEGNCKETGKKSKTCLTCNKIEEETTPTLPIHIISNGRCTICEQEYEIVLGSYIKGYDPSISEDGTIINTSYTSPKGTSEEISGGIKYTGNGYEDQTFRVSSIVKWKIAKVENGQLIITPASQITTIESEKYFLSDRAGYANSIEELNKISSIYGQGKYADTSKFNVNLGTETISSGARCITLDDIGYKAEVAGTSTYTRNPDTGLVGNYAGFVYYDEGNDLWKRLDDGENITFTELKCTPIGTLTEQQEKMVFRYDKEFEWDPTYLNYWIASRTTDLNASPGYNIHSISSYSIGMTKVCGVAATNAGSHGVRPVVYLNPEIQIEYNSDTGEYKIR